MSDYILLCNNDVNKTKISRPTPRPATQVHDQDQHFLTLLVTDLNNILRSDSLKSGVGLLYKNISKVYCTNLNIMETQVNL